MDLDQKACTTTQSTGTVKKKHVQNSTMLEWLEWFQVELLHFIKQKLSTLLSCVGNHEETVPFKL